MKHKQLKRDWIQSYKSSADSASFDISVISYFLVGFTTNNQMPRKKWNAKLGKHNDRSIIQHENDLFEMLGDQGFMDLWHPFIPIELKNMDEHQKGTFLFGDKGRNCRHSSKLSEVFVSK